MKVVLVNLGQQLMGCSVCKEVTEIPRGLLRDQHALLVLHQETEHDHRECRANRNDLSKAIRDRLYRKRMEKELAKAAGQTEQAHPRCQHRRGALNPPTKG